MSDATALPLPLLESDLAAYLLRFPREFASCTRQLKVATGRLEPAAREELSTLTRDDWTNIVTACFNDPRIHAIAARHDTRGGEIEFDSKDELVYVTNVVQQQFALARKVMKGIGIVVVFVVTMVIIFFGLVAAFATAGSSVAAAAVLIGALLALAVAVGAAIDSIIDYVASFFPDSVSTVIAVGVELRGGGGGTPFQLAPGEVQRLTKLEVHVGSWGDLTVIVGLGVAYLDRTGAPRALHAGGRSDKPALTVELAPGDELIAISGRAGGLIESMALTIRHADGTVTSQGPVGGDGGNAYRLALPTSPIRGFVGRAGGALDALAVQGANQALFVGRTGGAPFIDKGIVQVKPGGVSYATRLTRITLWGGDVVDAIAAAWIRDDGVTGIGVKHGGNDGTAHTLELADDEVVTKIEGATGWYRNFDVISRLVIHTSKGRTLAAGRDHAGDTRFPPLEVQPGTTLVGFYGFAGGYLDGLGLCVR